MHQEKLAEIREPVDIGGSVFKDFIGGSQIVICEAGVHYRYMGMTDDPSTQSVGDRDASYFVNYQVVGQATLAYLDALRQLDVPWVTLYTVADPVSSYASSTSWRERFGLFLGTMSNAGIPGLESLKVYSNTIPWALRCNLASATRGVSAANQGTYWHKEFVGGNDENIPI